ncbi:Synaptotagmin-like protein 2, partial [Ophiophagus hannah]
IRSGSVSSTQVLGELIILSHKQRKNPFNDSTGSEDNAKTEQPENGMTDSSEATEEVPLSPSIENLPRVNLSNYSRAEASKQPSSAFRQTEKLPVPKARKNIHKTSDESLQSKDSLPRAPRRIKQVNGQGRTPKSILKRSSSSSSTDSEVLRLSQTLEPPNKSGLPTSPILEDVAEKSPTPGEDHSQNSLKQVRFSSSVNKNERPPKLELHEGKELGEFSLLDTNSVKAHENEVNYLDGPSSSAKSARSYSPSLDGNMKDGPKSREGEIPTGSYSFNDSGLPSLVKSLPTEEPSRKLVPSTMDNETVPSVSQSKTKQPNPEPCDTTQPSAEILTVSLVGQELRLAEAEEAMLPKSSLADPEQDLLNLKPSLYQRGELMSKDLRLQDVIKQPGQLLFSENESPSDVVLGDQPPSDQSKENKNATSHNIHSTKRTHFQTIDQSEEKMDENHLKDIREDAVEGKTYVDLKNSDASFRSGMKKETSSQIDGERDVKSFLEEENIELKPGETPKDPKGKDCSFLHAENMAHATNKSNLVLQQHELQQPSMIGDKKRVKDVKAFWEAGKMTPELGNKEVLRNENMSNYTKEYGRLKPVCGPSGYVTSESDNEQSKYNLVTFRKVELSEEDSEVEGDDVKSSGTSGTIQGDKSMESQDINIANEVLSNDQKNTNVTGLLNKSNLQPSYKEMASSKESERPKVTALEKETILQPKSPFKIHSLKEKTDEESRSQMLNPSQFQSLRNFWDTGSKFQSKIDETIPQKHKSSTGSYTKELQERIGNSQAILDDGRSGFPLQEEETKKPTAKISYRSPLAEPMFSPSATTVPMRLDSVPIRDKDSSPVLPEKEHAGIKIVSPEIQHNVVHRSFQPTVLAEELQESACPPRHEKGIPCVELVGKDPMAPNDQIQEPGFVLPDTNGKAGLKTSEVVEIVNRTSVPPKVAANTMDIQEVIERVEKSTVPSDSRQVEFKARFQTLLKENSEILSRSQKITESSNEMQINKKSTENRGFISQQETGCVQEVSETANKSSAPSRFQQSEFNSSLQKLLKEAAQAPPSQHLNFPQEETIMKSVAPAKEDRALKSNLEKLILEHFNSAPQPPTVDCKKDAGDSTPDLAEQRLPVPMPTLTETASSDYRSELKIPLTEKASKQTDGGTKISENMAFQKIFHLNLASSETPCLEKDKDFPSTADKTEDRSMREKETEFSTSLIDANRSLIVEHGLQRSSTPVYGSPLQTKEVELHHTAPSTDDDNNDDGGAKNCESDFSEENKSILGSQSDPICSEEELNPVMKALKRSSNRQIPSKSVEDIPSATSNKEKINLAREDLVLSAEDAPSFSDSQFSRPEKIKMMSKSSDDRETDTASESSYLHGRITKSPSSLTNLSGSSGLASLSSVSTSVMSVYSGDFGNVDVKGNLQFAIDYVEQLKEFHIFIAQGKDLAIADVKRQRSDPYVKSYLLPEKHKLGKRKTSVKKKTLNPYKIDKAVLENQRLNISVWHHDTFGRNSFLGEVELDLVNWDWKDSQNKQMIWYPLKP